MPVTPLAGWLLPPLIDIAIITADYFSIFRFRHSAIDVSSAIFASYWYGCLLRLRHAFITPLILVYAAGDIFPIAANISLPPLLLLLLHATLLWLESYDMFIIIEAAITQLSH